MAAEAAASFSAGPSTPSTELGYFGRRSRFAAINTPKERRSYQGGQQTASCTSRPAGLVASSQLISNLSLDGARRATTALMRRQRRRRRRSHMRVHTRGTSDDVVRHRHQRPSVRPSVAFFELEGAGPEEAAVWHQSGSAVVGHVTLSFFVSPRVTSSITFHRAAAAVARNDGVSDVLVV